MSLTKNFNRTIAGTLHTNLIKQFAKQRRHTPGKTLSPATERKPAPVAHEPPASKYVDTKAAYQHLGISKASFFRLRKLGHFSPSPITGRYHIDDLDREARGHRSSEIKPQIAKTALKNAAERRPTRRRIGLQPASISLLPSTISHSHSKFAYEKQP
jgi:hypothetical protein